MSHQRLLQAGAAEPHRCCSPRTAPAPRPGGAGESRALPAAAAPTPLPLLGLKVGGKETIARGQGVTASSSALLENHSHSLLWQLRFPARGY